MPSKISAKEYQYNGLDFVLKYCHKNKLLLNVKKKMFMAEKALLIIVVPSFMKKNGGI